MVPLLYPFAKTTVALLFFVHKTKGLLLSSVNLHNQDNNLNSVFFIDRRKFDLQLWQIVKNEIFLQVQKNGIFVKL